MLDQDLILKALDSKTAAEFYNDGLSTPIKETSKLVTYFIKTAQLLCLPLQYAACLQERLERRLQSSVEQVPEENRIIPPNSIGIPIINHLSYLEDGILVALFQNLLARAMDKMRNSEAHPAFIITINQLSSDEATLLYELKTKEFKFTRSWDLNKKEQELYNIKTENNEFPLEKLVFPNNFDMYLEHLQKLDLICVTQKKFQPILAPDNKEQIGGMDTYTIGFTSFGKLFLKACFPENA